MTQKTARLKSDTLELSKEFKFVTPAGEISLRAIPPSEQRALQVGLFTATISANSAETTIEKEDERGDE